MMKFFISIVFFWFQLKQVVTLDCYWNTECKYKYFSSKTPYENVRGDIRDSIVKPEGCEAISVWSIMRHGKRNPGTKFGEEIKNILKYKDFIVSSNKIGNSSLCAQDIENLKHWEIDKDMLEKPDYIAGEGYQELVGLGSRLHQALPKLLNKLQENEYLFVPAFGQRMQDSAKGFVEGLTNDNLVIEKDDNGYSILAPYSTCGKFQAEVFWNPDIYFQVEEYKKTTDYLKMKEDVIVKLGLNFTLSDDNIIAMYDLCRYSWNGITNTPCPWCAIFSDENLKVLEYIQDMRHYYRNGYGLPQYGKVLGQMPLSDLLTKFKEAKTSRGKKIVSYFTHATMLDMIIVVLDLYKDPHPLTGMYRDENRKWRTTFLSTFASNMIAVLNRCSNGNRHSYDYNVTFYWNERPLLELCQKGVCSWQEFEDIFKPFLNATTDVICEYKWTKIH